MRLMVRLDLLDFLGDPPEAVCFKDSVPVLGDAMLVSGITEGFVKIEALDGSFDVLLRKGEVVMQRQRLQVLR